MKGMMLQHDSSTAPTAPSASYLTHSEDHLLELGSDVIRHATRSGATQAVAYVSEYGGIEIKVREGVAERAVRNGGQSLSVSVHADGRRGTARTGALDADSIARTVDRALAIAREVEPEPDAALADRAWIAFDGPEIATFAPSGLAPDSLLHTAREIEAAALAHARARGHAARIDQAAAVSGDHRSTCVMSNGFARAQAYSMQSRACVAIVDHDGEMSRDYWSVSDRRLDGLLDLRSIAELAVDRTAARAGARSLSTRSAPILLDARICNAFVFDLVNGLGGHAQHQGSSFLADSMDKARLSDHVDLTEDPFEAYGMASGGWDSDGIAGTQRHIVRAGVIEGYFLSARWARKLGLPPTGSADGPRNLRLLSQKTAVDDDIVAMLGKMHNGLWVTDFKGGGVNPVTGDYSKAVEGFWIENGQIVCPIRDVTIAGRLPDMFRGIVAIGADQMRQGAVRSGSILLENMRIAG